MSRASSVCMDQQSLRGRDSTQVYGNNIYNNLNNIILGNVENVYMWPLGKCLFRGILQGGIYFLGKSSHNGLDGGGPCP